MASEVEEIELRLTTDGGKTVSRTLSGVKEEVSDVAEEAKEAGQQGAESFDRMGDSASEAAADVDRASERMESTTSSIDRMGGASDNASELLFSLGDTAQDAQFGLRGMGNNIGFAAEQASVLVSQAGSGRQALGALTSAIAGPAGVVLAIQGLIALGPQIIDFFDGSSEAADEFNKKLEEQADSMFEISEEAASFEAQTLDQAQEAREQLGQMTTEQEQVIAALNDAGRDLSTLWDEAEDAVISFSNSAFGTDAVTNDAEALKGAAQAAELLGLEAQTVRDAIKGQFDAIRQVEQALKDQPELLPSANRRLKALKESGKTVENSIISLKAAKLQEKVLAETAADRADNEEEAAAAIREQAKQIGRLTAANLRIPGAENEEKEVSASFKGFKNPEAIDSSKFSELEEGPRFPDLRTESITQINNTIGRLQRKMDSVDSSKLENELEATIGHLRGMKSEIKAVKQESLELGPALQQGLTNAIASASQAAAEGESIMKSILQVLASLAQRVGKMLIAFGVGGLGLEAAFKGNPGLAIAAGSALVALGSAVKSQIQSEVESATSGGASSGRTSSSTQSLSGDATGRADVPGFRHGVDNFGGGLARVHRDEMIALPPGANVLTNENAKAVRGAMSILSQSSVGGGSSRDVNVRTEHEVNGRIDVGDGFRLVERIDRIREDREDLVGGSE